MNNQEITRQQAAVEALRLSAEGFSCAEISRKLLQTHGLHLSRSAVIGIIHRLESQHADDRRDLRICGRLDQGHPKAAIARDAGVTLQHVEDLARGIAR